MATHHEFLHDAVRKGDVERVRALLEAGADPNVRDGYNRTPLHWAALAGDVEAIKALLEAGADPRARDRDNATPLHYAAQGQTGLPRVPFLAWFPLHYAARGQASAIKALLKAGADLHARDDSGKTPLHWAATCRSRDAARALLAAGADPNARDAWALRTPLHYAVLEKCVPVAHLLLERGADPDLADRYGMSPRSLAYKQRNLKMVELLELFRRPRRPGW